MSDHSDLKRVIEAAWEDRESVSHATKGPVREAVMETLERLDAGTLRVASREADGTWITHQWAKQAILLFFRLTPNFLVEADAPGPFWDKIPLKCAGWDAAPWKELSRGARAGAEFATPPPHAQASIFFTSGTTMSSTPIEIPARVA